MRAALDQMVRSNRRKEFAKKMGKIEWEGNLDEWMSSNQNVKKHNKLKLAKSFGKITWEGEF